MAKACDLSRNDVVATNNHSNPTFELLQEQDILQLRDISDEFADLDPEQVKAFLAEKQNIALVAKLDGKVIGFIYGYALSRLDGKAPHFFIYSVDIHTGYQNKGYGSRFMQFAVGWARDNGFGESFVAAESDNARACRIYEKAGMSGKDTREFVAE